ncbi:MAG TPA: outer membrane protein transport protein [Planctomycetota bacterium]|nr:outer membrane protein transport protein [Planctomycetota bacterium]
MKGLRLGVAALVLATSAGAAWASNGEKPTAFGAAAGGRGGVDYAFADDATAPQTNPAGLGFVNDRIDWDSAFLLSLGFWENSFRRESLSPGWTTAPFYQIGAVIDPGGSIHIQDMGDDKWGLGSVKADDYGSPFHLGLGVYTDAGTSFNFRHIETPFFAPAALEYRGQEATIKIGPTFAFRPVEFLSFGWAPALRYSRLDIDSPIQQPNTGLSQSFQAVIPSVMTYAQSHNLDSVGFTQRFGLKLKTEYFSAGLVYQDRSYSDAYRGQIVQDSSAGIRQIPAAVQAALFQVLNPNLGFSSKYDARVEHFESPRQFGAGIQISPFDRVQIGLDYTYIMWSEFRRSLQVRISNPRNTNFAILSGSSSEIHVPLEWGDQSVIAAGIQATVLQGDEIVPGFHTWKLILRAGYNWGQSPLPRTTINPALPLIFEHHASAGFTLAIGPYAELTNCVIHAFSSNEHVGVDHANTDLNFSRLNMQDWAVITQLSLKF